MDRSGKEKLFPALQAEIAEDKAKRDAGVTWPDQSTEAFKDEVQKQATPNVGPQLTKPQRTSFIKRVLRAFSVCFWVQGCSPPRVTGYTAHIEPMATATPRIQQPFPLSAFDQLRLEYHEDCEVEDNKAEWVLPGRSGSWGSPSFVVDQPGKGLLGRPVRDYRYVNAQTMDTPWPSPNASAVLDRAQKGAIHSTLDLIWGFASSQPVGFSWRFASSPRLRFACDQAWAIFDPAGLAHLPWRT